LVTGSFLKFTAAQWLCRMAVLRDRLKRVDVPRCEHQRATLSCSLSPSFLLTYQHCASTTWVYHELISGNFHVWCSQIPNRRFVISHLKSWIMGCALSSPSSSPGNPRPARNNAGPFGQSGGYGSSKPRRDHCSSLDPVFTSAAIAGYVSTRTAGRPFYYAAHS
jgi:hypothetical protein